MAMVSRNGCRMWCPARHFSCIKAGISSKMLPSAVHPPRDRTRRHLHSTDVRVTNPQDGLPGSSQSFDVQHHKCAYVVSSTITGERQLLKCCSMRRVVSSSQSSITMSQLGLLCPLHLSSTTRSVSSSMVHLKETLGIAWFGLQTTVSEEVPKGPAHRKDMDFAQVCTHVHEQPHPLSEWPPQQEKLQHEHKMKAPSSQNRNSRVQNSTASSSVIFFGFLGGWFHCPATARCQRNNWRQSLLRYPFFFWSSKRNAVWCVCC